MSLWRVAMIPQSFQTITMAAFCERPKGEQVLMKR